MALIITLHNISAPDAPIADYEYVVRVNDRDIERGTVTGHTRTDTWSILVGKLLRQREITYWTAVFADTGKD